MPKWMKLSGLILLSLSILPFAFVARSRAAKSADPRVHPIPDMDNQSKFRAQAENDMFADGRAMRPPVEGTVARGELMEDDHLHRGKANGQWAGSFPMPVTIEMMMRGRERYGIYCTPCHGLTGEGDGIVAIRADRLQEGTWVPPASFHTEPNRARPVGYIYNVIANGVRNMPAYGSQISVEDRWAIVAYVRALQRSRNARLDDVPADKRTSLE